MTRTKWKFENWKKAFRMSGQFAGEFLVLAAIFGILLMFMCISSQGGY